MKNMNREIKFRAWDNVDYMSKSFTLYDLQLSRIGITKDAKIMQFTGLKDKNGKDIYEGDILCCRGVNYKLEQELGKAYELISTTNPIQTYFLFNYTDVVEVVSNIYQPILTNEG